MLLHMCVCWGGKEEVGHGAPGGWEREESITANNTHIVCARGWKVVGLKRHGFRAAQAPMDYRGG